MISATHSPIDLYVINAVKEKRMENGYSQKELAFLLEVSIAYIGNVESPKHRAKYNLSHLNDLAVIFKCSPKDFLPQKPIENEKWQRPTKETTANSSLKPKKSQNEVLKGAAKKIAKKSPKK